MRRGEMFEAEIGGAWECEAMNGDETSTEALCSESRSVDKNRAGNENRGTDGLTNEECADMTLQQSCASLG